VNEHLWLADLPVPVRRSNGVVIQTQNSFVSAGTERMLMDFVKKNLAGKALEAEKAGVCFTPQDAEMLVEKLTLLKNDPDLRSQLAKNAIAAAPTYSRTELATNMLTLLEKTVTHPPIPGTLEPRVLP